MRQGIIIYNPTAGRFPSRLLCERAAKVLEKNGWLIFLEQSCSGEHITELAHMAARDGLDAIFVAGGDGSINRALVGIAGSDTALGVLPCGTANVWAQELGLPGLTWARWAALEESAHKLANARVERADIGVCNGRPFLLWAGVGLDAFIVHRIEPRKPLEKHFAFVQYAASLVWNASYWHGVNIRVEIEGRRISGHFLLALVSNVHLYAGGLAQLSPNAKLDDHQMDLWLFEGETLGDTVQLALELLSGSHIQSPRVHFSPFEKIRLVSESPTFVQVDGEPCNVGGEVNISVQSAQVPVMIPNEIPRPLFGA
jgi:YegS/Rv2252/BmrU family lipid kinase